MVQQSAKSYFLNLISFLLASAIETNYFSSQVPCTQSRTSQSKEQPYAEFLEKPTRTVKRFRYIGEGRIEKIFGFHSTATAKTSPTIQVKNYVGSWQYKVSCVTNEKPNIRPR